jgi:TonB-linked SusC/RagA family outer membrane protein
MKKQVQKGLMTLVLSCCLLGSMLAQRAITGKVTDGKEPLIGVSVVEKGTTNGSITDIDGAYSIKVGEGATLVFTFVGYLSQEIPVGNNSVVDLTLAEDTKQLGEVVVTSFGIKREKKALSYAVTELKADDILNANNPNVIGALQGQVPGALITTSSGAPGAGVNVILRGINSLAPGANNQPLVVIDGMLMSNETVVSGVLPSVGSNATGGSAEQFSNSNRLADLNPNDIESMSVLKGAAASALYGSNGSNGVIVITTKKGATGKPNIQFNTSYSMDELAKFPDIQSQYLDGLSGYRRFAPNTVFWQFGPRNNGNEPFFNNQKNFFTTGTRTDNALSISGGNDKFTYLSSLGYFDQSGIIPNTRFKRLTGRLNSSYQATNWLKLTGQVSYTNSNNVSPNGGDKSIFSALSFYSTSWDVNNYKKPDGSEIDYSNGIVDNPRWVAEFSTFSTLTNRYTTQFAADAKLLDWLSVRYQIGLDAYGERRTRIAPAATDVGSQVGGFMIEDNIKSNWLSSDLLLTAEKKLTDDLNFKLLVGNQVFDRNFERISVRGERFAIPNFYNIRNVNATFTDVANPASRLVGVFADLNLEYKDFIFLTASARNDWTSTLPKGRNSFFYPSVGLSFLATEAFKMPEGVLSYAKIRASYAESGKGTDPYLVGRYYELSSPFGTTTQTRLSSTVSDPNLLPERTAEIEFGADIRFFKNRIGIDATYFQRKSQDLILPLTVSNTTGFARYVTNVGEIENKGIELALNTTPVKMKDFQWDVNVNFTKMEGVINRISDSIQQFDLYDASPTSTPMVYRYKTGGKIGDIYGYTFSRHSSGALLIGANGFPIVNQTQYVPVGNAIPDFILAGTTRLRYKDLSISALFEWRNGGNVVDLSQRNSLRNGILTSTQRRYEEVVFNGVLADGTPNTRPVEINETTLYRDFGRYNGASEILMQDGSWLRLRNVTVAYNLPTKLLKNLPFKNIGLRLSGNNLWLNTPYRGYDPEGNQFGSASNVMGFTGFVTPPTRNVTIGLNISFK